MQLLQALYTHAGVQIPASPKSSMRACMSKASMPEIESVHKFPRHVQRISMLKLKIFDAFRKSEKIVLK